MNRLGELQNQCRRCEGEKNFSCPCKNKKISMRQSSISSLYRLQLRLVKSTGNKHLNRLVTVRSEYSCQYLLSDMLNTRHSLRLRPTAIQNRFELVLYRRSPTEWKVGAKLYLVVSRPCRRVATCYTSTPMKYGNTVTCPCNSLRRSPLSSYMQHVIMLQNWHDVTSVTGVCEA